MFWVSLLSPSYPKAVPNRYLQSTGNRQRPNLNNYLGGNPKFRNQWSILFIVIYLLTAIGLTRGGNIAVHIYTQTIHRTTQLTSLVWRLSGIRNPSGQTKINYELTAWKVSPNWEECGPCPFLASYTPAFAIQLRKKHGKPSVMSYLCYNVENASCCSHAWYHTVQQGHANCYKNSEVISTF